MMFYINIQFESDYLILVLKKKELIFKMFLINVLAFYGARIFTF